MLSMGESSGMYAPYEIQRRLIPSSVVVVRVLDRGFDRVYDGDSIEKLCDRSTR